MTSSPRCLAARYCQDHDTKPPYSNIQISERAILEEVVRIYRDASRETRELYELGWVENGFGKERENWIIRWMLWHVARYRDNRNKRISRNLLGDGSSIDIKLSPVTTSISKLPQRTSTWILD